MGIELPPWFRFCPNIKDPASLSEMLEIPSADSDDNIKDTGDEEKVGGKDELMVEEVGDDAEQDC